MTALLTVRGARLHNLKNINLSIPKNQLVVLTGVSGSGKSTLGFDILLKEGQRQYMESLGMLPFGMARPPVDAISGLAPTLSVDQYLTNRSPRSTVGTVTDVYTFLRVLFARLGRRPCAACGKEIGAFEHGADVPLERESDTGEDAPDDVRHFPCPHCGAPVPEMSMASFSFNKPAGACPTCTGLGSILQVNISLLVDEHKSILDGAVIAWNEVLIQYHSSILQAAAAYYGFELNLSLPLKAYPQAQRELLFYGVEDPRFRRHFPAIDPPAAVRAGRFEGIATNLMRRYAGRITDTAYREKLDEYLINQPCPDCSGTRLRPESRAVTVNGKSIVALCGLPLTTLAVWLEALPAQLSAGENDLAAAILADLHARIGWLIEASAGYLTLARATPSLSAGEAQRLRLASLLGSELSGLLYVFDEPTIGLHQRDTQRLIRLLRRLRDLENTVLVIEHDLEMIRAADYVIDFGPGAGKHGGEVVAAGTPAEVAAAPASLTGAYLSGRESMPVPPPRRSAGEKALLIHGVHHNNLQNISVRFPLGLFIAVTGVSGSGKSSLVFDVLDRAVRQQLGQAGDSPGSFEQLEGWEDLDQVITIDQEHLRRMPRSNAATYTEVFDSIRKTYAAVPEARERGFSARHFSFNVPGGRCPRCEGSGVLAVQMHFLPDVEVRCPACLGRRFTADTLAVRYNGYDIAQVLEMTMEEALELFRDVPTVCSRLQVLCNVGLGYLQLGQPATTLSGGEAQRVKLAKELGRRSGGRTLYLLDEPTTGLHTADIARLMGVLQRLVDAGNTVIVVEHNLELVKAADWVIDLGPEGGAAGGKVIAEGTPEQVAQAAESYTGMVLKELLKTSRQTPR